MDIPNEPKEPMVLGFQKEHRFLSNFHPSPLRWDGLEYPCGENAFQAAKSLDPEVRKTFQTMTPGEAKRAGRKLALRPDWETAKNQIMLEITRAKFNHPANWTLRERLIATGIKKLEERNSWGDRIWGTDMNGKGQNRLGKILMEVRQEIILSIPAMNDGYVPGGEPSDG